jgi:DNA replication protein DnaC
VLCEDEIARRDTAALARGVRRARFEQPNAFEDFDFTVSPKLPAAMLARPGRTALARGR